MKELQNKSIYSIAINSDTLFTYQEIFCHPDWRHCTLVAYPFTCLSPSFKYHQTLVCHTHEDGVQKTWKKNSDNCVTQEWTVSEWHRYFTEITQNCLFVIWTVKWNNKVDDIVDKLREKHPCFVRLLNVIHVVREHAKLGTHLRMQCPEASQDALNLARCAVVTDVIHNSTRFATEISSHPAEVTSHYGHSCQIRVTRCADFEKFPHPVPKFMRILIFVRNCADFQ